MAEEGRERGGRTLTQFTKLCANDFLFVFSWMLLVEKERERERGGGGGADIHTVHQALCQRLSVRFQLVDIVGGGRERGGHSHSSPGFESVTSNTRCSQFPHLG